MIKVSHELPLCLLDKSKELNDYDFCLPTYWFKSEEYKQYFLNAKAEGRFIIADNGLFNIGSSLYEEYVDLGIKHIAFNHSSTAYQQFFPHKNLSVSKMMGRIYFINRLLEHNIIEPSIHHHLLGCAIPDEFKYYGHGYEFIKTLDTSNPVVWGCKGYSYDDVLVSIMKPSEKIEEFFHEDLASLFRELIFDNIKKFKSYL